jgi:hypothetical protein
MSEPKVARAEEVPNALSELRARANRASSHCVQDSQGRFLEFIAGKATRSL